MFSRNKWWKNWHFFPKLHMHVLLVCLKNWIITSVFKKSANFSAIQCWKLRKTMILTLTVNQIWHVNYFTRVYSNDKKTEGWKTVLHILFKCLKKTFWIIYFLKYTQWQCKFRFDNSTAMYKDLKTLRPGGIRTWDLLFWRRTRWPLCMPRLLCHSFGVLLWLA
jgi:hypothetical protein